MKPRTQEQQDKSNASLLKKQESRRKKIKDKGIDYEFDGHVSLSPDIQHGLACLSAAH